VRFGLILGCLQQNQRWSYLFYIPIFAASGGVRAVFTLPKHVEVRNTSAARRVASISACPSCKQDEESEGEKSKGPFLTKLFRCHGLLASKHLRTVF
jgi:hypothetical protein